ncbi:MAG: hypothetical protein LBU87_01290 [Lactobacillales bacterium]|jgi:hypothetical protein|nr:hypothetical protein [Lactobacillales bacterium]
MSQENEKVTKEQAVKYIGKSTFTAIMAYAGLSDNQKVLALCAAVLIANEAVKAWPYVEALLKDTFKKDPPNPKRRFKTNSSGLLGGNDIDAPVCSMSALFSQQQNENFVQLVKKISPNADVSNDLSRMRSLTYGMDGSAINAALNAVLQISSKSPQIRTNTSRGE